MMGKSGSLRGARRGRRWSAWSLLAGSVLGVALGAASCGGTAGSGGPLLQSNTNWLQRCGPDAPCSGALLCLCGMCTQPCSEAMECGRLDGATCGGSCAEAAPSGGGMCVLGCSTDDDCGDEFVCQATECRPRPAALDEQALGDGRVDTEGPCSNAFVSLDSVFERALNDLRAQDANDQPFLRYLSLANRNDAGACGDELERDRLALAKALNSASLETTLEHPVPIDADRLLYRIDLRHYDWDQPRSYGGIEYADAWEMLIQITPYALDFEGPEASALSELAVTRAPLLQSDALVHSIARGPAYMSLTRQPGTLDELFAELGVDAAANRRDGAVWRAATTQSRISRANRILERHELEVRAGALWMTLDFLDDTGLDIFENPLASDADGGTVTYSLPNGLPGFALYDGDGLLTEDSEILLDTNQNNFRALTAVSCMNCHTDTIIPTADEVTSYVAANPGGFSQADRESIARLYPGPDALRELMSSDNTRFRNALESLGVARGEPDPVAMLSYRFEGDMTPIEIAGDLMLAPTDMATGQTPHGVGLILTRSAFEETLGPNLCSSLSGARNRPTLCSTL